MEFHCEKQRQFDRLRVLASAIGREFRLKRDLITRFAE
jgi:hypothetical protein